MSRDWKLILWSLNAGIAIGGIIIGVKTGNPGMCFSEGILLGLSVYIVRDAYMEEK